eukprot:6204895-Pleurochrysis_carterae.AAC.4
MPLLAAMLALAAAVPSVLGRVDGRSDGRCGDSRDAFNPVRRAAYTREFRDDEQKVKAVVRQIPIKDQDWTAEALRDNEFYRSRAHRHPRTVSCFIRHDVSYCKKTRSLEQSLHRNA